MIAVAKITKSNAVMIVIGVRERGMATGSGTLQGHRRTVAAAHSRVTMIHMPPDSSSIVQTTALSERTERSKLGFRSTKRFTGSFGGF